jgi:hypothetical protein
MLEDLQKLPSLARSPPPPKVSTCTWPNFEMEGVAQPMLELQCVGEEHIFEWLVHVVPCRLQCVLCFILRDVNPGIPNPGIPANFRYLLIPGLSAVNPGIKKT